MIGTTAGAYRILGVVSEGGMGTVYRAEHSIIGRTAAVKVLHPEMSTSRDIVNRFFNEARATTSIKHPGIVEVYDFGYLESGHAYLVMEFLEGYTMAAWVKQRGAVPEGEAAVLLRGVCSALAAAHAKGIVHRDLKPDNIFLVPDPDAPLGLRPKLLDFGIAKLTDVGLAGSTTKTGAVMGTPTYMSPEQCKGTGDVDLRADLYSLGCMFYELVAGRPPFVERGAGELIGAHLFVQPEPPTRYGAQVSPDTEALIMALLAKQPAQRPQSALELGQRLSAIAQRTGYTSSTSWEQRPSVAGIANHDAQTRMASHLTPMGVNPTPAPGYSSSPGMTPTPGYGSSPGHATPAYSSAPGTGPVPNYTPVNYQTTPGTLPPTQKPTTLSGAASHSIATPPAKSSKWIVGVAAVALIGGGIAVAAVMGGSKKDDAKVTAPEPTAASAPTPTPTPTPTPAPAPTPTPTPTPAPAPAPTPTPTPAPATAPTTAPTPATDTAKTDATKTDATKTDAAKTDAAKTDTAKTDAAKTDTAKTDTTKTSRTDATKKTTTKTTTKKTTTKKTDPLLETDL